uniref:NADH-ubiquinone oxidoreductase chain 6 n=1 Tax=Selenotoca multifasciata TaxID=75040 RepID=A0A0E3U389_9TELE|nr:NADH dehydrogenase subunit 6 [Selenotoca multifasciata]AKC58601.1 NADH dehydrogenase subunit 6 [Selenotoca multifasciata]
MTWVLYLSLGGVVLGAMAVASNPSPHYSAFGMVFVAGCGGVLLMTQGMIFLGMLLFLIYLGGMLIVFMFANALASEAHPMAWGSQGAGFSAGVYTCIVILAYGVFGEGWGGFFWHSVEELNGFSMFRGDLGGVALMYSLGGGMLVISAWVLLLTLFVVLELTRGLSRGTLRAV